MPGHTIKTAVHPLRTTTNATPIFHNEYVNIRYAFTIVSA